jgi:hypothetical protein
MEALKLSAAKLPHGVGLIRGFNSLRSRFDTESARQGENGVDDRNAILGTLRRSADEGLVDRSLKNVRGSNSRRSCKME